MNEHDGPEKKGAIERTGRIAVSFRFRGCCMLCRQSLIREIADSISSLERRFTYRIAELNRSLSFERVIPPKIKNSVAPD